MNMLLDAIERVLDGIDRDQTATPPGWWETGAGAYFGTKKLREIRSLVASATNGIDSASVTDTRRADWVRYCPACGAIGEVPAGKRDCCPDGIRSARIPERIANQARTAFLASIAQVQAAARIMDQHDTQRLEFILPIIDDDWQAIPSGPERAYAIVVQLMQGKRGREAVDAAMLTFQQ